MRLLFTIISITGMLLVFMNTHVVKMQVATTIRRCEQQQSNKYKLIEQNISIL